MEGRHVTPPSWFVALFGERVYGQGGSHRRVGMGMECQQWTRVARLTGTEFQKPHGPHGVLVKAYLIHASPDKSGSRDNTIWMKMVLEDEVRIFAELSGRLTLREILRYFGPLFLKVCH